MDKIAINNNWGIIIQARTGSTRLPNKVLLSLTDDRSVLSVVLDNLKSNFSNKFEYQFLIDLLVNYFEECIKLHGISFTKKIIFPSFEKIEINFKKDAFNELTKQNYVLASELKNPHYIWLKKALKIN